MLTVIMLTVIMLTVIMLTVIMLTVIMLTVIMLSVILLFENTEHYYADRHYVQYTLVCYAECHHAVSLF
jgi:hypothetical protein